MEEAGDCQVVELSMLSPEEEAARAEEAAQQAAKAARAWMSELQAIFNCGICNRMMDDPCSIPCGHTHCISCLRSRCAELPGRQCPVCNEPISSTTVSSLRVAITIRDAISALFPQLAEEARAERSVFSHCVSVKESAKEKDNGGESPDN